MKGTIRIKVTPHKEGPCIRRAVRLRNVGNMDKIFLLNTFLDGLEISVDHAKVFLELIEAGVVARAGVAKEGANHE